ncbi:MAG: nucleotidyltransferase family protein [Burkholderiaceae bacterium]
MTNTLDRRKVLEMDRNNALAWLRSPLVRALRDPATLKHLDAADWSALLRQANGAGLLARLQAQSQQLGIESSFPRAVQRQMNAAQVAVVRQTAAVHWEVKQIAVALTPLDVPVVLLKGAAYAAAGLPAALGRTFSDVDILVPKAMLEPVERALVINGWIGSELSAYDQRYYRRWMHELPPMLHIRRRTPLDVHHNILPETARIKTRPELLLRDASPLFGYTRIFVPSPLDQVLHSATHLFHEGEWAHGLRDLSDLDLLLRSHRTTAGFWQALCMRSSELNLRMPLRLALRYVERVLQTPVPADVTDELSADRANWLHDQLFLNGLASAHHSLHTRLTRPAQSLLYVRSHWMRMPLYLLLPHLAHKAWARRAAASAVGAAK